MLVELFGKEVLYQPLANVKAMIRSLPPSQKERRSYLLHEYAVLTDTELSDSDFKEVEM